MFIALTTAATGMLGQELAMDIIANNLANANTTGFKKQVAQFKDLLYQTLTTETGETIQMGQGTQLAQSDRVFTQGVIEKTGNTLDIAIEGSGFFVLTRPDGTKAYTRDGTFRVDNLGRITTSKGELLSPSITVPQGTRNLSIGADGQVTGLDLNDQIVNLGTIQLALFINPKGLEAVGGSLYTESVASGVAQVGTAGQGTRGILYQGFLERSNVDMVEEMVGMIVTQRAYELNSKAIQTADQMLAAATNLTA